MVFNLLGAWSRPRYFEDNDLFQSPKSMVGTIRRYQKEMVLRMPTYAYSHKKSSRYAEHGEPSLRHRAIPSLVFA